jgi:hypothetical protein
LQDLGLDIVGNWSVFVDRSGLGHVLGAEIGRQAENGVTEVDGSSGWVGKLSFVQDLKEDVGYVAVSFLDLVQVNDGVRYKVDGYRVDG